MQKNKYLIVWQAHRGTSNVETISGNNEEVAKQKIIRMYGNRPEYQCCEIKIICVNQVY